MKPGFGVLAACGVVLAVPAAASAQNVSSDRLLTASLPAGHVVIWPGSTTLTLKDDAEHGGVATVEADPFPYDGAWQPVASGIHLVPDVPVELTVRPERNTRYRVRDDHGREVVVGQTVDLYKRLWSRHRCLSGESIVCTRGRQRFVIRVLVKGPRADVRRRRLVIGLVPDGDRITRVLRYRLRRVGPHRWQARARLTVRVDSDFAVALSEPRDDPFGDPLRRPYWDQDFKLYRGG